MNILIICVDGREYTLAWKCKQNSQASSIHASSRNDGIETVANCWYLTNYTKILLNAVILTVQILGLGYLKIKVYYREYRLKLEYK